MQAELQKRGYEAMAISAVTGLQVRPLLYRAAQLLDEAPPEQPVEVMPVYRPEVNRANIRSSAARMDGM